MKPNFYKYIFIFLGLYFPILLIKGQDSIQNIGRGGESFLYPYKSFTYVQPRFDRQSLFYGNFFDSYVIRAGKSFPKQYHLRVELPVATTNTPDGDISGLSDIKIRLLHSALLGKQWYLGYGLEATLPTAVDTALGSGKWQARPELGAIYFFGQPNHIKGSFLLAVDYRFDFAGQSDRNHVSVLGIVPNIDYWGNKWYAGYYATWTYDFINKIWDIPVDVEVGYTFIPKWTLAFEYIQPLLKERMYNYEYAVKIRYMF